MYIYLQNKLNKDGTWEIALLNFDEIYQFHSVHNFKIQKKNIENSQFSLALITSSSYHNRIFDLRAGAGASSTSVGPFPGNWLAARIADLTPDLQVLLS